MAKLNETAIKVLNDLMSDIEEIMNKDSNIEVIWALEKLHQDEAFFKSANLIRKSLNK